MNKQLATKTGGISALLIIPFIILFIVYLPNLYELVKDWATDGNYSHGFLIPVVSAYLIWQKKKELALLTSSVGSNLTYRRGARGRWAFGGASFGSCG